MQISWFTIIAQIVNFIVLVWLLKRFLYKPILKAIDEREKKIATQIKDAEAKDALAKKEQFDFAKKNDTFDNEKKGLMEKAITEINDERQKLLETARNDASELRANLDKALKEMEVNMEQDLVQKTQKEVFAIARKALSDLASQSLEEQSANIFIKRLKELDSEEKKQFAEVFKSSSNPLLVQSAFDLPKKQQADIENAVNEIFNTKHQFQFETAPKIISGIELTANGYKLAWSISEYLNSLQKNTLETMKKEARHEPTKVPKEIPAKTIKEKSKDAPKETPSEIRSDEPENMPETTSIEVPSVKPQEVPSTKSKSKSNEILGKE